MIQVNTKSRPAEGWHQTKSGGTYFCTHVGQTTQIEVFEKGKITPENQQQVGEASRAKALRALSLPDPISQPMQRS